MVEGGFERPRVLLAEDDATNQKMTALTPLESSASAGLEERRLWPS